MHVVGKVMKGQGAVSTRGKRMDVVGEVMKGQGAVSTRGKRMDVVGEVMEGQSALSVRGKLVRQHVTSLNQKKGQGKVAGEGMEGVEGN